VKLFATVHSKRRAKRKRLCQLQSLIVYVYRLVLASKLVDRGGEDICRRDPQQWKAMAMPWGEWWERTSAKDSGTTATLKEGSYGFGLGKRPSATFPRPEQRERQRISQYTDFSS
jgi:hypothetical protein